MICLRCDNEIFKENPLALFEQIYKGKQIVVTCPGMFCVECGYTTVTLSQADVLIKKTEQAYLQSCKKQLDLVSEPFKSKVQIAKLLGKTTRTVDNYMANRIIPFHKLGWTVMFKWTEVEKAITHFKK